MTEYEVGYGKPPKDTRFGGSRANPRNNGSWKKDECARGKFEILIKKNEAELKELLCDINISSFDEGTINLILQVQRMSRILGDMVDELDNEEDIEKKVKLTNFCMNQLESVAVIIEKLTDQIYGKPKQMIEQTNLEAPAPRLPKDKSEE